MTPRMWYINVWVYLDDEVPQFVRQHMPTFSYIALRYATLHYNASHCLMLSYTILRYTTRPYIMVHVCSIHYMKSHRNQKYMHPYIIIIIIMIITIIIITIVTYTVFIYVLFHCLTVVQTYIYCMFSVVSQKRLSLFRIFIYSRKHAPNTWSWMKWIAQLDVAGGLTHTESMEITNDPRFFQDRLFSDGRSGGLKIRKSW